MLKDIYRIVFYISLFILSVFLWTVTFGQKINIEFKDHRIAHTFYDFILIATPLAILLTLFGTLKKAHNKTRKIFTILATIGVIVLTYLIWINFLFTIGFGRWTTFNIAYEYRTNPNRQIREQRYDVGALGYGGKRIVEVRPFAGLFWNVSTVDTTSIDKKDWIRINKEVDVKFP